MMSAVRVQFHQAVLGKDFGKAALALNGLSMLEMLQALAAIGADNRQKLILPVVAAVSTISANGAARINYALQTVENMAAPATAPGDLATTGQVQTAQDFVKEPSFSGKTFTSEDAAAKDVLTTTNPFSINQNREYGGWIVRTGSVYAATRPVRSPDENGFNVVDPVLAPGAAAVALYHMHGSGYEFENGSTAAESFSMQDRVVLKNKKADGYLGTPSGKFWRLRATAEILAKSTMWLAGTAEAF